MKRFLSFLMVIAITLCCVPFAQGADLADNGVAANSVTENTAQAALRALGIINGYQDSSFNGNNNVTRAEMAKMLVTALGHGDLTGNTPFGSAFNDTTGHWAEGYINYGAAQGFINGDGYGFFNPNNSVSGADAATMLLRALGYNNASVNGDGSSRYSAGNYITKGFNVGIYKNVQSVATVEDAKAAANLSCTRDVAADLIYGALSCKMVGAANPDGKPKLLVDDLAAKMEIDPATLGITGGDQDDEVDEDAMIWLIEEGLRLKSLEVERDIPKNTGNQNPPEPDRLAEPESSKVTIGVDDVFGQGLSPIVLEKYLYHDVACNKQNGKITKIVKDYGFNEEYRNWLSDVYSTAIVTEPYSTGTYFAGFDLPATKPGGKDVNTANIYVTGEVTKLEDIAKNDVLTVMYNSSRTYMLIYVSRNLVEGYVTDKTENTVTINDKTYSLFEGLEIVVDGYYACYLDRNGSIFYVDRQIV